MIGECPCASLTESNRCGTDPYARWCGRGDTARCLPIPINQQTPRLAHGSLLTRRWRETDSNPRSPGYGGARCIWRRATRRCRASRHRRKSCRNSISCARNWTGSAPRRRDLCRDFFRRAVAPRTLLLQAAYAGRTDGGIRCGLRGRGSSGWPHGMPRSGLGGRGWSRPRPREVPPFRLPM
jgi:hypothetical protein